MIQVFYKIQNDKEKQFNLFQIPGNQVTLKDIIQNFPLKHENYHFRFRTFCSDNDQKQISFLDITNLKAKVPTSNDCIFMKVLILPQNVVSKQVELFKANQQSSIFQDNLSQNNPQNIFQNERQTNSQNSNLIQENKKQKNDENLLDFSQQENNKQNLVKQFVEMDEQNNKEKKQVQKEVVNQVQFVQPVMKMQKDLIDDSHMMKLSEREKQEVKEQSELAGQKLRQQWKNEEEFMIVKQQVGLELEPQVIKWAKKGNQRNDIRTLLCTLHEILWENSGLKKINLANVLDDNSVKKQYLIAIRVVHPDKVQNADERKKYIAERVFYELKEGFQSFQNK